MAEIVNLRRVRKAKAREEAARIADANRLAFGRSGAEKLTTARETARVARMLDGARRDDRPGERTDTQ